MNNEEVFVAVALNSWKAAIARVDHMFSEITDEGLQREIAPDRNRIYYLLGHLTAIHDRLFSMLDVGERLHPELDEEFIENPDRTFPVETPVADLRKAWSEVNASLTSAIEPLSVEEWLNRHGAVSVEDFDKDPLRNRLAVLMSRTNHASFHAGQIRLTK